MNLKAYTCMKEHNYLNCEETEILFVCICLFFSGPGFNLFLRKFNFKLGPFEVDSYRSPGVSSSFKHFKKD